MSYVDFTDRQALTHALLEKTDSTPKLKKSKLMDLFQATLKASEPELNLAHKPIFDWLRKNHYDLIVDLVEEHKLPLSLLCGNSPALIEQLVILDITLQKHAPTHRDEIIAYAKKIAKNACSTNELSEINNTNPLVLQALEKFGKLIYVIQHDLIWMENGFDESYLEIYEKKCQSLFASLKELETIFRNTGVQSPHDALSMRLPQAIAEQVLTSDGYVNVGLLEVWNHQSQLSDTNYGCTIKERLTQLFESPSSRNKLFRIKIRQPETLAHQVIRISLNLPHDTLLNDQHGRTCALTALLSHIRQTPSYSCFSLVICISQLTSNLDAVLEDFHELLTFDKVQRKIGHQFYDFPFLLAMANKDLDKPLNVDEQGRVEGASDFLWKCPGLQAACHEMGFNDPQKAIENALILLKAKEFTISNLLKILSKQKTSSPFNVFRRGCFAFEAQTNNALLAVWSNAVAGMAEGKLSGILKSELLRATMWGLDVKYKGLEQNKIFLKDILEQEIINKLIDRISHQYDPLISDQSNPGIIEKQYGGFVLYECNQLTNPSTWIRLDNPEAFKAFISKVIIESGSSAELKQNSSEDKVLIKRMTQHLSHYVHTNDFLDRLLPNYMQQRFPFVPSTHLEKITQTPWITLGGNDTETTLKVYTDETKQLKTHKLHPSDAYDLLECLIAFGRTGHISHPKLFHPRIRTIARISGLHAFNITLGHPSLEEAWKDTDIKTWINTQIVTNGKLIQKTILSKYTKSRIGTYICSKMLKNDKNGRNALRIKMKELDPKQNLISFSSSLRTILDELVPIESQSDRNAILDTIIVSCLPKKLRTQLTKNCIHIGDTNWSVSNQDVHFCFVFNPCSDAVELWKCGDKNKNFQALNQDTWVTDQDWELLYF